MIDLPDIRYARASDGAYIAYQVLGEGPVDLAWQFDFYGNIDVAWESPFEAAWLTSLSSVTRLILHDRRATGLSSRNMPAPNLETRVSDLLTVLDAVGAERPVVAGLHESGAPAALLAATTPHRIRSIICIEPRARSAWAPDYPWGKGPREMEDEMVSLERWGTAEYAHVWSKQAATEYDSAIPDGEVRYIAKASRQTCTPDVARGITQMWYETDIRGLLPSVQVPALFLVEEDVPKRIEEAHYIASLMPSAEVAVVQVKDWPTTVEDVLPYVEEVRRFVGLEPAPVELDTLISTILFTDIVASTERQVALGDRAWKQLVEGHHALVRTMLDRWHGVENDTAGDGFYATFDGPARAIRCAIEIVERVRDLGIEVRAGVHTGECELIDGKVGGVAVTVGARVSSLAAPSEVLISQTVKDLVAGSGLVFEDAGQHELKGVPDRWQLYRVGR